MAISFSFQKQITVTSLFTLQALRILFDRAWFVSVPAYGTFKTLFKIFTVIIFGFIIDEVRLAFIQIRVASLLILMFKKQSLALYLIVIFTLLLPTNRIFK